MLRSSVDGDIFLESRISFDLRSSTMTNIATSIFGTPAPLAEDSTEETIGSLERSNHMYLFKVQHVILRRGPFSTS